MVVNLAPSSSVRGLPAILEYAPDSIARDIVTRVGGAVDTLASFMCRNERAYFHMFFDAQHAWFLKTHAGNADARRSTHGAYSQCNWRMAPDATCQAMTRCCLLNARKRPPVRAEKLADTDVQTQLSDYLDKVHALSQDHNTLMSHNIGETARLAQRALSTAWQPRPQNDFAVCKYREAQTVVLRAQPAECVMVHGMCGTTTYSWTTPKMFWLKEWSYAHIDDLLEDIACSHVHAGIAVEREDAIVKRAMRSDHVCDTTRARFTALLSILEFP